jgi:lysozyme
LIKEFEGCRLNAYPDPLSGGLPITIGWGWQSK